MPRPPRIDLSIAQLENIIQQRKSELSVLNRQRDKIQQQLNKLDARIMSLGGSRRGGGRNGSGGRVRNERSLVECLESVLKDSGKPMQVGDITDKVKACGYRTNSANF